MYYVHHEGVHSFMGHSHAWDVASFVLVQIKTCCFFLLFLWGFCLFFFVCFYPAKSLALSNWLAITQKKIYMSQAVTSAVLTNAVLSYMLCPYSYCIELSYVIYRYKLVGKGFVANTYFVLHGCCFSRNNTFFFFLIQLQKNWCRKRKQNLHCSDESEQFFVLYI